MQPFFSIVIPAYNEAARLPRTLESLAAYASEGSRMLEVLIVVERSPDGTLEIAREAARQQEHSSSVIQVIDNGPQRGKGHAVRSGMLQAKGDIIFYMDADLSVPLKEVDSFLHRFHEAPEVDVLIGNRQHARSKITLRQSLLRRSMGQTFNRVLAALALTGVGDTQCGFKAFRRTACQAIFSRQQVEGFAFDVEVLMLAATLGFKIDDLPVEWRNSPESKVNIFADSFRMLRDTVAIRQRLASAPGRSNLAMKDVATGLQQASRD